MWPPVPVTTTRVMLLGCDRAVPSSVRELGRERPLPFIHPIPCAPEQGHQRLPLPTTFVIQTLFPNPFLQPSRFPAPTATNQSPWCPNDRPGLRAGFFHPLGQQTGEEKLREGFGDQQLLLGLGSGTHGAQRDAGGPCPGHLCVTEALMSNEGAARAPCPRQGTEMGAGEG